MWYPKDCGVHILGSSQGHGLRAKPQVHMVGLGSRMTDGLVRLDKMCPVEKVAARRAGRRRLTCQSMAVARDNGGYPIKWFCNWWRYFESLMILKRSSCTSQVWMGMAAEVANHCGRVLALAAGPLALHQGAQSRMCVGSSPSVPS